MLYTPSMHTRAERYGRKAASVCSSACGSPCANVATFAPLARAILAASCIELCACSSIAMASCRPTRPGIAPRFASITEGRIRTDSTPSQSASRSSASTLARTLANARDEPLCVPHRASPRRIDSCTRGSWSRPRKLSEPKLISGRPSTTIRRPGPDSSSTRSFKCAVGMVPAELLDDLHEGILSQGPAQLLHRRRRGHGFLLASWVRRERNTRPPDDEAPKSR